MFFTRRFILFAAALGAGNLPSLAASLYPTKSSGGATMRLRALLPASASAREIGRHYLARYPEEEGDVNLARLILSPMSPESGDVAALDHRELSTLVTSRVRADFENGRTVEIGGWILSRTEVRLCALWI
jgi:hypothetical protein